MLFRIALLLLIGGGLNHLGLGIVYITADEFMGYHAQALQLRWTELDSNHQRLLLALIRLAGAGAIVAALVNLYLCGNALFRNRVENLWLAAAAALIFQLTANYVVYTVARYTPGEPPLAFVTFGSVVILAGAMLLVFSRKPARGSTS